jgi:SAM-dependent methyltransferase
MKRHAPATQRNKDPILEVLKTLIPPGAKVLEVASGTGEHAIHFARHLPVTWQPSDLDVSSVEAYRAEAGLPNLLPAIVLDARTDWDLQADVIVCINMIHISPWSACEGLVRNAARVLPAGGILFFYGPFLFDGVTAPSNEAFSRSLRAQDPSWGVRDERDVTALCENHGFERVTVVPMPANNHCLAYRKQNETIPKRSMQ